MGLGFDLLYLKWKQSGIQLGSTQAPKLLNNSTTVFVSFCKCALFGVFGGLSSTLKTKILEVRFNFGIWMNLDASKALKYFYLACYF